MAPIHELFASNLRKYRRDRALTQEQLALKSGVTSEYISRLEAAKRNPTLSIVEKLAIALDLQIADLFAEKAEDPTTASAQVKEAELGGI